MNILDKRIPLYKWKAFRALDELNLLGLFFDNGLAFKKNVKHLDNFMLGNFLSDIDTYFYHKQMGAKLTKPVRKKFK
jgi:hypothetical protein